MAGKHWKEQYRYTKEIFIPYFDIQAEDPYTVVVVGCAEGGAVDALNDALYKATGIDKDKSRLFKSNPDLAVGDITKERVLADLVIARDVIEHIEDKVAMLANIGCGYLFITFPPKWSAYAGHQQGTWLKLPFLHYLPNWILRLLRCSHVVDCKKTAISIREFEKLLSGWDIIDKNLYLSRPIYKIRFGWPVIKFPDIPFLREFASGAEYLLERTD